MLYAGENNRMVMHVSSLGLLLLSTVVGSVFAENPSPAKLIYRKSPARAMTVYYPPGWKESDRRAALVIFRCNVPEQRQHFLQRGMVVIKPSTTPVNSGLLPSMTLEAIAQAPKPKEQVKDCKSAIRYIRSHSDQLGIDPTKVVATGTSGGADLALLTHLNRAFTHPEDELETSSSPDALVLYAPAFDGLDIWFVKSADFLARTRAEAPAFEALLGHFVDDLDQEYLQPLDHRATLISRAAEIGAREEIADPQIATFQEILGMLNKRDWQLLHPVEDARLMSASRLLTRDPLPPTIVLLGDRDHLREAQSAFVRHARQLGQQFELKEYENGGHSFMIQPAFESTSTSDVDAFLVEGGFLAPKK